MIDYATKYTRNYGVNFENPYSLLNQDIRKISEDSL